jgi:NAD(P)H-dependent flavin oxidoreductase YrpB (nitropropane dioxygenase family)
VPVSEDKARLRAAELIDHTREHRGRVHRFAGRVFVLTTNPELAEWLMRHGARAFTAQGAHDTAGGYLTATDGPREWDLNLSTVPLLDDEPNAALWEAAAP